MECDMRKGFHWLSKRWPNQYPKGARTQHEIMIGDYPKDGGLGENLQFAGLILVRQSPQLGWKPLAIRGSSCRSSE